ncbi:hypothetical protein E0Z10_g3726 [Xylaria hypoxylon]|uniref:Uncharacterized protein n=1 Tax=Xylaria hypoxylon TaxID=37992 RepID=A0A4Z0Z6P9_9PEZI|nr:hypothetical protein E0Z10_g3726 [Xylaria hypoxylon]
MLIMKQNLILDLPVELRLIIYEFAVIKRVSKSRSNPLNGFTRSLVPPPLACVNRQLRQEITPEYYGKNEFWIELPIGTGKLNEGSCELVTKYVPLMKSLSCQKLPEGDNPGFFVYQCVTHGPTDKINSNRGRGCRVIMNEDGKFTIELDHNFRSLMARLIRAMEPLQFLEYRNAGKGILPFPMSDSLHFILKHFAQGNFRMETLFNDKPIHN